MANQQTPGFGAPRRPGAPPGSLGFSGPPPGYGPANQGAPPGSPRPAQAFAPQGPYPAAHLPGGASPPRPPTGPPFGFPQYAPPGGARSPRLPYGAPSPVWGLGPPQAQKAAFEQGRQSPQGRGGQQAPLLLNATRMPGPYETTVGAPRSGNVHSGNGRSSPIPTWQNTNPSRIQTASGRSSPIPRWQNANPGPEIGLPTRPLPPGGRAEDWVGKPANAFRATLQPVYPPPRLMRPPSESADGGAMARALRPAGLTRPQLTGTPAEQSGRSPGPLSCPPPPNQGLPGPERPYSLPLGLSAGHSSNPAQKDLQSGSGPRGFAEPFSASNTSDPGSRADSAWRFSGFERARVAPAGASRVISEENLIASFINPKAQKSIERVRSKSRPPRRKAEGKELLQLMEEFDAVLFGKPGAETATQKKK